MPRPDTGFEGPLRLTEEVVDELNRVFSESFTDRYQRDGLSAVRVPPLPPIRIDGSESAEAWCQALQTSGRGSAVYVP